MTLITCLQRVADEVGVTRPTAGVTTSSDVETRQLLSLVYRTGKHIRMSYNWPFLSKEYTFTTVSGQANYALPGDFQRFHFSTHWDRQNSWEMIGPLSAQDWQAFKSGIVSAGPRRRWRMKGQGTKRFYIDPTPDTSSETLVFEYISTQWFLPKEWEASTAFSAGAYCSYDGNVYTTTAGGTTGATPPTHTSSSASDGSVTWTYSNAAYTTFTSDYDEFLIDEDVVSLGVQWRFLAQKGMEYEHLQMQYENALKEEFVAQRGAKTLSLAPRVGRFLLNRDNLPDTGFGA